MGRRHRDRAFEIPPGLVTFDERLVLVVLADQTFDDNDEWGHDRDKLAAMCGLDPTDDNDQRWLRDRLKALEEAGWITRAKQRKLSDGRWGKGPGIRLNFVDDVPWSSFSPTKRAADRETARLNRSIGMQKARNRRRDEGETEDRALPVVVDSDQTGSAALNEIKAALVKACGEPTIESGWGLLNRAATMIRDRGGTAADVEYRAGRLVEEWGPERLTLASLEKHWTRWDAAVGQVTADDVDRFKRDRERQERRRRIVGGGGS